VRRWFNRFGFDIEHGISVPDLFRVAMYCFTVPLLLPLLVCTVFPIRYVVVRRRKAGALVRGGGVESGPTPSVRTETTSASPPESPV
jgi:hypothetical protein